MSNPKDIQAELKALYEQGKTDGSEKIDRKEKSVARATAALQTLLIEAELKGRIRELERLHVKSQSTTIQTSFGTVVQVVSSYDIEDRIKQLKTPNKEGGDHAE